MASYSADGLEQLLSRVFAPPTRSRICHSRSGEATRLKLDDTPLFYNLDFESIRILSIAADSRQIQLFGGMTSKIISFNTLGGLVRAPLVALSTGLRCSPQANESNNPIARGCPNFLT